MAWRGGSSRVEARGVQPRQASRRGGPAASRRGQPRGVGSSRVVAWVQGRGKPAASWRGGPAARRGVGVQQRRGEGPAASWRGVQQSRRGVQPRRGVGSSRVEARGPAASWRGVQPRRGRGSPAASRRGVQPRRGEGSSRVEAWGSSRVVARESSRVEGPAASWRGSSSVEARESSSVEAWESSSVEARGDVFIRLYSARIIKASASVLIKDQRRKKTPIDNNATVIPAVVWKTAAEWCDYYGVEVKDGAALLFKE